MAFAPEIVNSAQTGRASLATQAVPLCLLCGGVGEPLYEELEDRLFSTPGLWCLNKCSDEACGLVWLNPMPTEKDIGKAYEDYYTHATEETQYATTLKNLVVRNSVRVINLLTFPLGLRRERTRRSSMYLESVIPGKLLDVGCGSGIFLERMRSRGWTVQGVEVDEKAAKVASNVFGLRVFTGTLHQAAFPDDYFDAITLSHVIEHVHDPIVLLKECRRVLKPHGILVVVTPNVESQGRVRFGRFWLPLDPPRHLHLFSKISLVKAARQAGFAEVDVWTTPANAEGIYIASRNIESAGRHSMQTSAPTMRQCLEAILFQVWAMLYCKMFRDAGEEVVLKSVK